MIQRMLAIWSLFPLPLLNPAWFWKFSVHTPHSHRNNWYHWALQPRRCCFAWISLHSKRSKQRCAGKYVVTGAMDTQNPWFMASASFSGRNAANYGRLQAAAWRHQTARGRARHWLLLCFADGDTEALKVPDFPNQCPRREKPSGHLPIAAGPLWVWRSPGEAAAQDRRGCSHYISGDQGSWGPGVCSQLSQCQSHDRREFGESESCNAGAQGNIRLHQMAKCKSHFRVQPPIFQPPEEERELGTSSHPHKDL